VPTFDDRATIVGPAGGDGDRGWWIGSAGRGDPVAIPRKRISREADPTERAWRCSRRTGRIGLPGEYAANPRGGLVDRGESKRGFRSEDRLSIDGATLDAGRLTAFGKIMEQRDQRPEVAGDKGCAFRQRPAADLQRVGDVCQARTGGGALPVRRKRRELGRELGDRRCRCECSGAFGQREASPDLGREGIEGQRIDPELRKLAVAIDLVSGNLQDICDDGHQGPFNLAWCFGRGGRCEGQRDVAGVRAQLRLSRGGQREYQGTSRRGPVVRRDRWRLLEDHVDVGARRAERAQRRPARPRKTALGPSRGGAGPGSPRALHEKGRALEIDLGIALVGVERGHQGPVVQLQGDLGQGADSRGGLGVADVGFH
jgi:hypothetical protein